MKHSDILIIGAGPTGLVLALWLTKLGVKVRIVDKTAEPGTTSRALGVQARTLELYRQLDLTDAVVKRGHKVPAVNLWVKGEPATRLLFERIGSDLTPYPFLHIFPQDQHERLLIDRLEAVGVSVERRTELVGFTDEGERVIARLQGSEGREEIGLVKVDMEFAVERAAGGFNIGDIEKLTVTASRKACADRLAHSRAGAVTASDVARLAGFLPALRPLKAGNHPLAFVTEADQFGAALDRDADCFQSIDQQPLMLVLWEDVQKRIRREVRADALEGQARRRFALDP